MKWLQHLPAWLKNKYVLTGFGFLLWISFFDDRDMLSNYRRSQELHKLEASRDYYQEQIRQTQQELEKLRNEPKALEKYAREHYRMKKDNEDLFITPE